jgi:hypothetical protein
VAAEVVGQEGRETDLIIDDHPGPTPLADPEETLGSIRIRDVEAQWRLATHARGVQEAIWRGQDAERDGPEHDEALGMLDLHARSSARLSPD